MTNTTLMREAYDLIEMAELLGPEGEGLDLTDKEYTLEHIVELRSTLASMRIAIDEVNRALAQTWADEYLGESVEYGGDDWYLGYAYSTRFIEGMDIKFAEWLKEQPAEKVAKIVRPYAISVTPIGGPDSEIRQTFFDEERTSADLRIKHRPVRRK